MIDAIATLPARVERERQRAVRDEPADRGGSSTRRAARGRSRSSAAAPDEVRLRREHDDAQLRAQRTVGRELERGRRDRRHAARPRRQRRRRGSSWRTTSAWSFASPTIRDDTTPRPRRPRRAAAPSGRASSPSRGRRTRSARSSTSRASPSSRTRPARSPGSTPSTTRRTGRSTSPRVGVDVLICSPYKFFGPHLGLAFARARAARALAPVQGAARRRRAARAPVRDGHAAARAARRLRRGGRLHRLDRLGRDHGARARARRAVPRRRCRTTCTLYGLPTMDGPRARPSAFNVEGRSPLEVADAASASAASRSGTANYYARRGDEAARPRRTAPCAPGSSTTTRPTRSTGCSRRSPRCEAARPRRDEVPRPCGGRGARSRAGTRCTLFNRGETNPELFPEAREAARRRDCRLECTRRPRAGMWCSTRPGYIPSVVRASAEALVDSTAHYLFVSEPSPSTRAWPRRSTSEEPGRGARRAARRQADRGLLGTTGR